MEAFPVELIRRVASYLPFPSLVSFSLTSHQTQSIVHDWQVYKAIIDKQIHFEFAVNPESPIYRVTVSQAVQDLELDLPSWTKNPITASTPPNVAAKYALADYKAYTLPVDMFLGDILETIDTPLKEREQGSEDRELIEDFVRWGGVLCALGHPLVYFLAHGDFHAGLGRWKVYMKWTISPTSMYTLSFCNSVLLLSDTTQTLKEDPRILHPTILTDFNRIPDEPEHPQPSLTHFSSLPESDTVKSGEREIFYQWNAFIERLRKTTPGGWPRSRFEGYDVPRSKAAIDENTYYQDDGIQTASSCLNLCVRTVGLLGWKYRQLIKGGEWPRFKDLVDRQARIEPEELEGKYDRRQLWGPPLGINMGLENWMRLGDDGVFWGDGSGFMWCHLEKMMTREFLEEGKWMGMYTYRRMNVIDPAMLDIEFKVTAEEDGGVLKVESTGKDKVGNFGLFGEVYTRTGRVQLQKRYENSLKWDWLAFMTPFGIVGKWGHSHWGGYVWLWKEEWYSKDEDN